MIGPTPGSQSAHFCLHRHFVDTSQTIHHLIRPYHVLLMFARFPWSLHPRYPHSFVFSYFLSASYPFIPFFIPCITTLVLSSQLLMALVVLQSSWTSWKLSWFTLCFFGSSQKFPHISTPLSDGDLKSNLHFSNYAVQIALKTHAVPTLQTHSLLTFSHYGQTNCTKEGCLTLHIGGMHGDAGPFYFYWD